MRTGAMVRGQRLALQLVRRGSLIAADARPSYRRGLGFYASSGELPCGEAKNSAATNEDGLSCRIPKLLSKYGDSHVVRTFSTSKGRQWLGFQKRGISSLEQATKASDEQEVGLVSRSDGKVGGQGQPPPSQPLDGNLMPTSKEEEMMASVLARPDLLITRNVEWANLFVGFEQESKYVIMDPHQPQAVLMCKSEIDAGSGVGASTLMPSCLLLVDGDALFASCAHGKTWTAMKLRRPFVVSVLDANGEVVCRVRRPAFLVNSSMFIEINGKVVGECHGRWHLWKRIYDVYIGNKQFATVENPGFWNWTFSLTDDSGGVLAEIDRSWRGFGFEFLTDAGQYVVRFGDVLPKGSMYHATPILEEGVDRKPILLSKNGKTGGEEMHQLQEAADQVDALAVARPLGLTERAVALALAVSLDNDYFSRHSQNGVGIPLPFPYHPAGAVTAEDSPEGSSNAESETGHEVFPRQGFQGSQSENIAANGEVSSDTKNDDPYFGMFDEPGRGDENTPDSNSDSKWGQFFDDTPEPDSGSGNSWGLGDWWTDDDS